jgi:3-methyladenine DNA glycosylase/8-oxoguanine DNA glycosylase
VPTRRFASIAPTDPVRTIGSLGIGPRDPSTSIDNGAWIAIRTTDGPSTLRFTGRDDAITAEAWGRGARRALETAPGICGALDDPKGFDPDHPLVSRLARERPRVRITRSEQIVDSLIRAVFGQKVTGKEAKTAYARMVRAQREPAPGPMVGLLMPPDPDWLAALDYSDFHPWGVERRRAEVTMEVARRARRLHEALDMDLPDAYRRIQAIRGVGPWSAAWVGLQALGDADAGLVGDFHIPNTVAWALAGEPRGDDDRMLELLEPFRPHRGRVIRLLKTAGIKAPKYGPRNPIREIRDI